MSRSHSAIQIYQVHSPWNRPCTIFVLFREETHVADFVAVGVLFEDEIVEASSDKAKVCSCWSSGQEAAG
jgi:hypothetical protein